MHDEFVVKVLEGAMSVKKIRRKTSPKILKPNCSNTGADRHTTVKRMSCGNSNCKDANQSKD